MRRSGALDAMVMAAAICSLVLGLGFGILGILGTLHFARTGEVWTFMRFPTPEALVLDLLGSGWGLGEDRGDGWYWVCAS